MAKMGFDYWTGTVFTTNRRVWEHDEVFKEYFVKTRAIGIDMETATLFVVGFANHSCQIYSRVIVSSRFNIAKQTADNAAWVGKSNALSREAFPTSTNAWAAVGSSEKNANCFCIAF